MDRTSMLLSGVGGVAFGAGLMYWLDPQGGRRRRALAAQTVEHAATEVGEAADVTSRDFANRTRGLYHRLFSPRGPASDEVIVERVRSRLGRLCSHPGAIDVRSLGGRVELSGQVLASEVDEVISRVARISGVRGVDNKLEVHERPDVPALQGGIGRAEAPELLQENWSPVARLLVGSAGVGLVGAGVVRRGLLGLGMGVAGSVLLARSITNIELKRLVGIRARRAIELRKSIHIAVPPDEVFGFFSAFENFPRFMSHVREVARVGELWHWRVEAAGVPFEWDAEVTRSIPNQVLAWKSVANPSVESAGTVRFDREGDGTRLDVRLSYNPRAARWATRSPRSWARIRSSRWTTICSGSSRCSRRARRREPRARRRAGSFTETEGAWTSRECACKSDRRHDKRRACAPPAGPSPCTPPPARAGRRRGTQ